MTRWALSTTAARGDSYFLEKVHSASAICMTFSHLVPNSGINNCRTTYRNANLLVSKKTAKSRRLPFGGDKYSEFEVCGRHNIPGDAAKTDGAQ